MSLSPTSTHDGRENFLRERKSSQPHPPKPDGSSGLTGAVKIDSLTGTLAYERKLTRQANGLGFDLDGTIDSLRSSLLAQGYYELN